MRKLIEVTARIETARGGYLCGKACLYLLQTRLMAQPPQGFCNLFQEIIFPAKTRDLRWTTCSECFFARVKG